MAELPNKNKRQLIYGASTNLFVTSKANGESIVVGGTGADTSRWVRILSKRAAQLLWFQMTQLLHPEKAKQATTVVTTAPMRNADLPTVTTHTNVDQEDEVYSITGWIGNKTWHTDLNQQEIERFWVAMTKALYPSPKQ